MVNALALSNADFVKRNTERDKCLVVSKLHRNSVIIFEEEISDMTLSVVGSID